MPWETLDGEAPSRIRCDVCGSTTQQSFFTMPEATQSAMVVFDKKKSMRQTWCPPCQVMYKNNNNLSPERAQELFEAHWVDPPLRAATSRSYEPKLPYGYPPPPPPPTAQAQHTARPCLTLPTANTAASSTTPQVRELILGIQTRLDKLSQQMDDVLKQLADLHREKLLVDLVDGNAEC